MKKKRIISLMLIFSLLLSLLAACGTPDGTEETGATDGTAEPGGTAAPEETRPENEFRIVASNGVFYLQDSVIEEFQKDHPDLKITVETFPMDLEEREAYVQQLRVQIMSGKGPDVYILYDTSPLFQDVTQSMHNGIFADISDWYDADMELDKDGLIPAVMEAGVLDGARYVLPLRYDIPLLYVHTDQLEAAGLELDSLGNGFSGLNEVIQSMGNESVAIWYSLGNQLLHLFPEALDYETDNVALTEEEMAGFLQSCKDLLTSLKAPSAPISYNYYVEHNDYWGIPHEAFVGDGKGGYQKVWIENGASIFLGTLFSLGDNLRVAKATGNELAVLPFRADDGSLVAKVTGYGAVGANCDDPGLAYEFLRKFLMEDSQWKNREGAIDRLEFNGWPILTKGSGTVIEEGLWKYAANYNLSDDFSAEGWRERREAMNAVTLTEDDFSILYEEIDKAYFRPASIEDIVNKIANRLDPSQNPNAADVDVNEFARELLQDLRMYLAEG